MSEGMKNNFGIDKIQMEITNKKISEFKRTLVLLFPVFKSNEMGFISKKIISLPSGRLLLP